MADALPTVAITSSAARRLSRGLLAGVHADRVLAALTVRAHVAGVAGAHPALERAIPVVAFRTIHFYFPLAAAVTFCGDEDFQGVPQPHGLYDEASAPFLAAGYAHGHIEGCLKKKMLIICFLHPAACRTWDNVVETDWLCQKHLVGKDCNFPKKSSFSKLS